MVTARVRTRVYIVINHFDWNIIITYAMCVCVFNSLFSTRIHDAHLNCRAYGDYNCSVPGGTVRTRAHIPERFSYVTCQTFCDLFPRVKLDYGEKHYSIHI